MVAKRRVSGQVLRIRWVNQRVKGAPNIILSRMTTKIICSQHDIGMNVLEQCPTYLAVTGPVRNGDIQPKLSSGTMISRPQVNLRARSANSSSFNTTAGLYTQFLREGLLGTTDTSGWKTPCGALSSALWDVQQHP